MLAKLLGVAWGVLMECADGGNNSLGSGHWLQFCGGALLQGQGVLIVVSGFGRWGIVACVVVSSSILLQGIGEVAVGDSAVVLGPEVDVGAGGGLGVLVGFVV